MKYVDLLKSRPYLFDNQGALLQIITDYQTMQQWQLERKALLKMNKQHLSFSKLGVVLEDPYFLVVRDLVQFPDGSMNSYSRILGQANLRGGRGVVVLPVFQGKIMLLHQYRHPTRKWHYEIPRGFGEPNTPAEENARKEIEEETGGKIAELVDLGEFYNNTGLEADAVSLFYARLDSFGAPNTNEGIESFMWLDISEFEQWIADEKITDGFTIAAYTKAKLRKLI